MAISGTYYIRMRIPHPSSLIDGVPKDAPAPSAPQPDFPLKDYGPVPKGFFEGEMTLELQGHPDGTLTGTANGEPIISGSYSGDSFIAVEYPAGPASWTVWASVDESGMLEGIVCLGKCMDKLGGFPNRAYGKKL